MVRGAATGGSSRSRPASTRCRRRAPAATIAGDEDDDLLDRLDAVLEDSVRVHQRSDVPYGLFLSGGINSAAIATLMARLNERPVTAFTCGFDAPGRRGRAGAGRAGGARAEPRLARDHASARRTSGGSCREVAWALDDPTADYATLPTYKLAEAAKGTLTVVLTGEGGDELFGGYGRYRRALRPGLAGRAARREPRGAGAQDAGPLARRGRARRRPHAAAAGPVGRHRHLAAQRPAAEARPLPDGPRPGGPHAVPRPRGGAPSPSPCPTGSRCAGRYGKWLLRKWLERACPAAEPWARKQGFTVPVEAWIAPRAADIAARIAEVEGGARVLRAERGRGGVRARTAAADAAGRCCSSPVPGGAFTWTGLKPAEALARLTH